MEHFRIELGNSNGESVALIEITIMDGIVTRFSVDWEDIEISFKNEAFSENKLGLCYIQMDLVKQLLLTYDVIYYEYAFRRYHDDTSDKDLIKEDGFKVYAES